MSINILFVCLGNICRSPMAESIFNNLLQKQNITHLIKCDSAGTADYHEGELADERTISTLKKYNITTTHLARKIQNNDYQVYDMILCMDNQNYKYIMENAPLGGYKSRVMLMRSYDSIDKNKNVPDPYYGEIEGFEEIKIILDRCCEHLLIFLKSNYNL